MHREVFPLGLGRLRRRPIAGPLLLGRLRRLHGLLLGPSAILLCALAFAQCGGLRILKVLRRQPCITASSSYLALWVFHRLRRTSYYALANAKA